jgi:hypothetical protein
MKITIDPRTRMRGTSLFLAIVLGLVVVGIGSCAVIQSRKFFKRVDGLQDRRLEMTNDGGMYLPPGSTPTNGYTVAQSFKLEWVDETNLPALIASAAAENAAAPQMVVGIDGEVAPMILDNQERISMHYLGNDVVVMGTEPARDWEYWTFDAIGIPREADNLPVFIQQPSLPLAIQVKLERSTNLVDWVVISTQTLPLDEVRYMSVEKIPHHFYRVRVR